MKQELKSEIDAAIKGNKLMTLKILTRVTDCIKCAGIKTVVDTTALEPVEFHSQNHAICFACGGKNTALNIGGELFLSPPLHSPFFGENEVEN